MQKCETVLLGGPAHGRRLVLETCPRSLEVPLTKPIFAGTLYGAPIYEPPVRTARYYRREVEVMGAKVATVYIDETMDADTIVREYGRVL